MSRFDQQMREVERSLAQMGGKTQATKVRKSLEKKIQQAAVKALPKIQQALVKSRQTGWVNDPGPKGGAVLVERDTGCVLLDFSGKEIRDPKKSLPPAPALDKIVFLQHLKDVEGFATHMYLDTAHNVTVGIGNKLDNPQVAAKLSFFERGTNKKAHPNHIINAFNKVKKSKIDPNNGASAFEFVTNIELSMAKAEESAENAMDDFLALLEGSTSFPDFASYPETAKMGLLDMAYTLGVVGTKSGYPDFTNAVRKRNWKLAATESFRPTVSPKPGVTPDRNEIVRQWFEQAARQEHFFINSACRPKRIKIQLQ